MPATTTTEPAGPLLRGRGRPKGTGINDAETLERIRALLSANRTMKPTTAIKQIGIADPSIVRRLRDKLKSPITVTPRPAPPASAAPRQPPPQPEPPPARATADIPPAGEPTDAEQKSREMALLTSYLKAMMTALPSDEPTTPAPMPADPTARPPPSASSQPPPPQAEPTPPRQAQQATPAGFTFPGFPSFDQIFQNQPKPPPGPQTPAGFTFPGMPPFLQPFQQSAKTPETADTTRQLEGMKLAVEAMTALAKMQLHVTQNAITYSPLSLMLQGQTFIGQMLVASFTGSLDALKKKSEPK